MKDSFKFIIVIVLYWIGFFLAAYGLIILLESQSDEMINETEDCIAEWDRKMIESREDYGRAIERLHRDLEATGDRLINLIQSIKE